MADRNHGKPFEEGPGGGKKCVVMHFEARGPGDLLEPWRCVEAGGAGTFWNHGDAF